MKSSPSKTPRVAAIGRPFLIAVAVLFSYGFAAAVDLVENFDGTELDAGTWTSAGEKSLTIDGGFLTWNADGGSWASGDLRTNQPYLMPTGGDTTSITWTLGPAEITNPFPDESGQSLRIQIGIQSANEGNPRLEHWVNTTGGLWIDFDAIRQNAPMLVEGGMRSANDEKSINSQGDEVGFVSINDWDWGNATREFRLELTATGFTWYDGATMLGTGTFAAAGIDTEFDNGFRILAVGMNFDGGQGTISVDRIAATGLVEPLSAISGFSSSLADPVSREPFRLSWVVDPTVTSLALMNSVDNVSVDVTGTSSTDIFAPVVTEQTDVTYTLTAVGDGQPEMRELIVPVSAPPELRFTDLFDDFDGSELDANTWVHSGPRTHSVSDGLVKWQDDGDNWAHGEVDSIDVFPIPEAGKPTTIIWTLGTASVTNPGPEPDRALRQLLGIASSFERESYSLQHWQNSSGGIWLDLANMSDQSATTVGGEIYTTDDTKTANSQGTQFSVIDPVDWSWKTEPKEFSLVLTDTGFTWFAGEDQIGAGTYAEVGLDNEFVNGFRILMSSVNYDSGRGPTSLDSIEVINGAAIPTKIVFTEIVHDPEADTTSLTWESEPEKIYAVDFTSDLKGWPGDANDSVPSQGATTTFLHEFVTQGRLFYRVRDITSE